jgi:hypothetical protein
MPARAAANRDFVSTFYRIGRRVEFLRIGDRYRNRRAGRLAEVAEILRLSTDAAGIMHVHFDLTAYCLGRRDPVGQRSLALAAFLDQYVERHDGPVTASVEAERESASDCRENFPADAAEIPGLG